MRLWFIQEKQNYCSLTTIDTLINDINTTEKDSIYEMTGEPTEYPRGLQAGMQFLAQNIKYLPDLDIYQDEYSNTFLPLTKRNRPLSIFTHQRAIYYSK